MKAVLLRQLNTTLVVDFNAKREAYFVKFCLQNVEVIFGLL